MEIVKCPSGLTIISKVDKKSYFTNIGFFIKAGIRNEKSFGIAHFLEHMVFKGTKNHTSEEINIIMDDLGGDFNAYTSISHTAIYGKSLVKDYLKLYDVLEEIYLKPLFNNEDFKNEKKVIIEEINMYDDDYSEIALENLSFYINRDTVIGHPILGNKEHIKKMRLEDLIDFYKENYTIKNTIVVVTGNFNKDLLERIKLTEKKDLDIIKKDLKLNQKKCEGNLIVVEKLDATQSYFAMGFNCSNLIEKENKYYRILAYVLGGSTSTYLFREIREKRGLCYDISSFVNSGSDYGEFIILGSTGHENLLETIKLTKEILLELGSFDDLEEVFERSKSQLIFNCYNGEESNSSKMFQLGESFVNLDKTFSIKDLVNEIESLDISEFRDFLEKVIKNKEVAYSLVVNNKDIFKGDSYFGKFKY